MHTIPMYRLRFAILLPATLLLVMLGACSDDDDDAKTIKLEMIQVPAGTFIMGDANNQFETNERPSRTVTISAFMMSKTEVPQKVYADVMGKNPSKNVGDGRPVENLTWIEAVEFCNKLSERDGLTPCYSGLPNNVTCDFLATGYRLPTEAEWEYACRAGSTTTYSSGNGKADLERVGWYSGNAGGSSKDVGQKPANAFGLQDMHGNVFEWCWDWYKNDAYKGAATTDPTGPATGTERVCRGGSWFVFEYGCRSSFRSMLAPAFRGIDVGVRLVRRP